MFNCWRLEVIFCVHELETVVNCTVVNCTRSRSVHAFVSSSRVLQLTRRLVLQVPRKTTARQKRRWTIIRRRVWTISTSASSSVSSRPSSFFSSLRWSSSWDNANGNTTITRYARQVFSIDRQKIPRKRPEENGKDVDLDFRLHCPAEQLHHWVLATLSLTSSSLSFHENQWRRQRIENTRAKGLCLVTTQNLLQALKIDPTRVTLNDLHHGTLNGAMNGKANGIVSDVDSFCKYDPPYGSVNSRTTFGNPQRVLPDRPKTPAGESTGMFNIHLVGRKIISGFKRSILVEKATEVPEINRKLEG